MNKSLAMLVISIIVTSIVLQASGENPSETTTINPDLVEWKQMNGPPGGRITKLIQNPNQHNELYALAYAVDSNRLYKSEDRAENWQLVDELKDTGVASMALYKGKLYLCCVDGVYYYDSNKILVKILSNFGSEVMVSDDKLFVTANVESLKDVRILYTDLTLESFNWKDISPSEAELSGLILPPEDIGFAHRIKVPNIVALGTRILANIIVEVDGSGEFTNGQLWPIIRFGKSRYFVVCS
jgi:hypothetical protein